MDEKVVDRPLPADNDETLRKQAVEDLRKRHDLAGHVLAYLTVNTFLVVIWYLTGAGFFWPAFPMFGWGINNAAWVSTPTIWDPYFAAVYRHPNLTANMLYLDGHVGSVGTPMSGEMVFNWIYVNPP